MAKDKVLAEPTRLSEIITNFNSGVRGVDIAIDLTHDPDKGAAGWIKGLQIAPSTTKKGKQALFAEVEWNERGIELIRLQAFRYFSSEFGPDVNSETQAVTENVLMAATMTNRPFVKGMAPIELDEDGNPPAWIEILREGDYFHPQYGELSIRADEGKGSLAERIGSAMLAVLKRESQSTLPMQLGEQNTEEVEEMDEALRALLTEHGIELAEGADPVETLKSHLATLKAGNVELDEAAANEAVKLAEANAKALEEANAENARLLAEAATNSGRIKALEEASRIEKRNAFLSEKVREGKLRPADVAKFEELYDVAADKVESLLNGGPTVVDLGNEEGTDSIDTPDNEDDADYKAAVALSEKKGITLGEAYEQVITSAKESE